MRVYTNHGSVLAQSGVESFMLAKVHPQPGLGMRLYTCMLEQHIQISV